MKRDFTVSSGLELDKVTELITKDIEQRVDAACIEIVNQAAYSCQKHAMWLAPRRLPSRGGGGYGRSHHMGRPPTPPESVWNRVRDAYNDHQWAAAIEFGTEPHEIRAKNPLGMRISEMLPTRGKGKGLPPSPPYGTKYVRTNPGKRKGSAVAMYVVNHPGGRSFKIYEEAWKRQCNRMVSLIRKVLKEKMK